MTKCNECANYKPIDREHYHSRGKPYDVEMTRDGATVTAHVWDMPEEMRGTHELILHETYSVWSQNEPEILSHSEAIKSYLYLWGNKKHLDDQIATHTFPTVDAARDYFEHITALIDKLNAEYDRPTVPSKWEHFVLRYTDAEAELTKTFETWVDKSKPSSIHINGERHILSRKPPFDAEKIRRLLRSIKSIVNQRIFADGWNDKLIEVCALSASSVNRANDDIDALLAALNLDDE